MTDPSIEDLMAELEAVKGELEKYKRDLEANTFEDTGPSVTVHFFPPYGYLYGGGGGNTGDHMYVSKKDFDKCVFDLKCWHRAYNDQINSLESALAHVKAESLRVVKVGNQCLLRHVTTDYVLADDGHIYQRDDGDWWSLRDKFQFLVGKDMFVQPVRLERWENSNEAD